MFKLFEFLVAFEKFPIPKFYQKKNVSAIYLI